MSSTLTRVLSAVGCALVVTACGGGESTSSQTRTALQEQVGALVSAVNAQDYPTARTALDALRSDVEDAQRLGALADSRAVELIRLADSVEAGLPSAPAPSAPAPAATRVPTSTPSPDEPAVQAPPTREPDKGKGRDKDDESGKAGD